MNRIEYEYPLFKVYYSNNSNNSNIRGNPVSLGLKETYSPDNVEASLGVMRRILACFDSCRLPYPAPSTWPFYLSCASLHSRQTSRV